MASLVARSAITAFHTTGLHRLFAPSHAGLGAVLAFHRVLPQTERDFAPNAALAVTPEFFASAIEFVQDRNYDIISLGEAHRRILAGDSSRRFCCLTFDDGYRDNFDYAWPLARRYGVPITLFVTTGFLSGTSLAWWLALEHLIRHRRRIEFVFRGRPHSLSTWDAAEKAHAYGAIAELLSNATPPEIAALMAQWIERYGSDFAALARREMLSWDDLDAMAASDLVAVGAHTVTHSWLSRLENEAVTAEMRDSRLTLEARLGRPVDFLAYPYGRAVHAGAREFALAAELGFTMAVTMRHGTIHPSHRANLHALPRITMNAAYARLPALDVFLSGTMAALLPQAAR